MKNRTIDEEAAKTIKDALILLNNRALANLYHTLYTNPKAKHDLTKGQFARLFGISLPQLMNLDKRYYPTDGGTTPAHETEENI